jgi:hypothetical protein
VDAWDNFFVGELGAAAALAGLLFVSISVNQARILELGRMADRGLDGLLSLLLALVVASVMLIPGQPPRAAGLEVVAVALAVLALQARLQRAYARGLAMELRGRARRVIALGWLADAIVTLAGLALIWRNDPLGAYGLAAGILMLFTVAGVNAWVLLIEINR